MRLVRTFGAMVLLAFAAPSLGLAVAPQNPQVVQDGAYLRVSWTPDADSTTGVTAFVSTTPDFIAPPCTSQWLPSNATQPVGSLRVLCPIAFGDTVYVRLTNALNESTDLQAPSASFDFRPIGPNSTGGTIRNRQPLGCRFDRQQWQRLTEDEWTNVKARLLINGRVVSQGGPFSIAPTDKPYTHVTHLTGAMVGSTARCEVTATNGVYSGTSVRTYRVIHALPERMRPDLILWEARYPSVFPYHGMSNGKVSRQLKAIGAISRGTLTLSPLSGHISGNGGALIFATPSLADRYLGKTALFCSELRSRINAAPVTNGTLRVTSCGRAIVKRSRRTYAATIVGTGRAADGSPMVAVIRFIAGTAGNGQYDITVTDFGHTSRLTKMQKRVRAAAASSAVAIALGLSRE